MHEIFFCEDIEFEVLPCVRCVTANWTASTSCWVATPLLSAPTVSDILKLEKYLDKAAVCKDHS